ncbi:hypothetical protein C3L23_07555 [Nautilia sp. PV-1]|uniref:flagellar hook-length control protein FliK n=1 Tax=Nautilia sp. PV-1 TaxID=2579250 RepID=UPI000FD9837E|nr:flagellar hook-length control protein FliK [Nautilia sp. PV-1]AZV47133.1 hypothetical protein C3L23_07555 [Nautilia sp. PV-1]
MSIIESLILNTADDGSVKPSNGSKGNFLLDLMKTYKDNPEELTKLFKNLNLNEKDLDKITLQDKDAQSLKKLIDDLKQSLKEEKTANLKDFPKPDIKNSKEKLNEKIVKDIKTDSTESEILKKLINETPISNKELEDKINKLFTDNKKNESDNSSENIAELINSNPNTSLSTDKNALEEKIVNVTKKMITSQQTLENIKFSENDVKEFKEIKTFKELVDFANKKELNISKIVISYEKNPPKQNIQQFLPKNKIALKTDKLNSLKKDLKFNNKNTVSKETPKNILSSLIKQTKDTLKPEEQLNINALKDTVADNKEKHTQSRNVKTDSITQNSGFSVDQLKQNIHKAKQSIQHFSSRLKEAIDNYKPPISKLSMELHPKELGKVEVTLVHRGDNLQIQINSNNTAVSFLHSQQQELRQNLINMGFTDVNMSFNQQQDQGNKEYRQNQKFGNNNSEENDELIIEIPYQYA